MRARVEWGDPRPADWWGPREPLSTRLPPELVRAVRDRARSQGVSVSHLVQRLIEAGLAGSVVTGGAVPSDLVTTLFD